MVGHGRSSRGGDAGFVRGFGLLYLHRATRPTARAWILPIVKAAPVVVFRSLP